MLWVMLESCQQNQDEKPAVPEKMPPTAAEIKVMKNAVMHSWLTSSCAAKIWIWLVNQLSLSNGWPRNYSNSKVWVGDDQGVMPAIPPCSINGWGDMPAMPIHYRRRRLPSKPPWWRMSLSEALTLTWPQCLADEALEFNFLGTGKGRN